MNIGIAQVHFDEDLQLCEKRTHLSVAAVFVRSLHPVQVLNAFEGGLARKGALIGVLLKDAHRLSAEGLVRFINIDEVVDTADLWAPKVFRRRMNKMLNVVSGKPFFTENQRFIAVRVSAVTQPSQGHGDANRVAR